ncbi:MAG: hypothetical protein M3N14_03730 [Bacteroidota bacterium]|nr:hypothetical protein [Bacteroidota bacterium]
MPFKFLKKRWHRVLAIVLMIITALILILGFLINQYWSPILASKVKDVVAKSSDGLYKINFSTAELHILRGTIVIYNITLKPDTSVYGRDKILHIAPNNLVELHVKRLTLSHIHPFKLYFQHKLEIGEIVLNNPEIKLSYQLNHKTDTVVKDNRTAWQKISKSLHSIHVGSIILGDVKFRYADYSGNKLETSELKEMNLSATDLLIDSATQTDKSRLLYCRDIVTELNNFKGKSASGLYAYKIKTLRLSTLTSRLNITGFSMQPVKPFVFFGKSHSDRFTFRLDSIQLNNFDFLNYHKYRTLNASRLILGGGDIAIFSNPNSPPADSVNKVTTFPNVLIHTLNTALKLDTISVHRLNIYYTEYNIKSHKTGTLTFNNTTGALSNITTQKEALEKNNIATAQFTSYFMNRGKLNVIFTFNLTDKQNSFAYKGRLGPMELPAINKAIVPLGMIKFNSGTVKRFDFDIKGDRNGSRGPVSILYNNLQVSLMNADTASKVLKKKQIASLFANVFIIKHDNPDVPGQTPRSFNVDYPRPRTSPFFKTIWKTLLAGIKPCAGVSKQTEQATTARINQNASDKKDRMTRKELRKQRRVERRQKRQEKRTQKAARATTAGK